MVRIPGPPLSSLLGPWESCSYTSSPLMYCFLQILDPHLIGLPPRAATSSSCGLTPHASLSLRFAKKHYWYKTIGLNDFYSLVEIGVAAEQRRRRSFTRSRSHPRAKFLSPLLQGPSPQPDLQVLVAPPTAVTLIKNYLSSLLFSLLLDSATPQEETPMPLLF